LQEKYSRNEGVEIRWRVLRQGKALVRAIEAPEIIEATGRLE
jgi:hypothetical protein